MSATFWYTAYRDGFIWKGPSEPRKWGTSGKSDQIFVFFALFGGISPGDTIY
jgi:hypothetical protein